jgi:hypothetical protein
MSLVPCRACGHQVDTSALACPRCGATDPAKKISRQQRDLRSSVIQLVFWLAVLGCGSWYVINTVIPMAKQLLVKPQAEQGQTARP